MSSCVNLTEINMSGLENFRCLQEDMNSVHSIIYSAFINKGSRILFQCVNKKIRILSEDIPNKDHLVYKFGIDKQSIKVSDYNKKLEDIKCGDSYWFTLVGNPVMEKARTGKIIPFKTIEDRAKWLVDRSEKLGFSIKKFGNIIGHPVRGKNNIFLNCAVFTGILTVTDLELFKNTIRSGIGREKAYGFGFLWLDAKVNEN